MSTQADKPERDMFKGQSTGEDRSQDSSSRIPDLALEARTMRLQALSRLIHSGEYHVPATAIAERMLERLRPRDRHQIG